MSNNHLKQDDGGILEGENAIPSTSSQVDSQTEKTAAERPFALASVLATPEFVRFAETFPQCLRKEVVACALQNLQLHPDGFGFWEAMYCINRRNVREIATGLDYSIFLDSIVKKLGIKDPEDFFSKIRICDFLAGALGDNGMAYHGFSGAFEESIRANGLSPGLRHWDQTEVDNVCAILVGEDPQGYHMGFAARDHEFVFYDGGPEHTYNYATTSPEWFTIFTGDKYGRISSYETARERMIRKLDGLTLNRGLSIKDKITILEFFEKYWKLLRGPSARPMVALIPKKILSGLHELRVQGFREELLMNLRLSAVEIVKRAFERFMGDVNKNYDRCIPASELTILELPVLDSTQEEDQSEAPRETGATPAGETYSPTAITEIVGGEDFEPSKLIEELKKDPELKGLIDADAGVSEGFSIGEHTEMALKEFEKYFAGGRFFNQFGKAFFRLLISMHDIGKPLGAFNKKRQHEETIRVASRHAGLIGMGGAQIKAMCAIIDGDCLGQYLRHRIDADTAARMIKESAEKSGLALEYFIEMLKIYFMCDAHSYSTEAGGAGVVDYAFESNPEKGELKFSPESDLRMETLMEKLELRK